MKFECDLWVAHIMHFMKLSHIHLTPYADAANAEELSRKQIKTKIDKRLVSHHIALEEELSRKQIKNTKDKRLASHQTDETNYVYSSILICLYWSTREH